MYYICSKQYGLERIHLGSEELNNIKGIELKESNQKENSLLSNNSNNSKTNLNKTDSNTKLLLFPSCTSKLSNNHSNSSLLNTYHSVYTDMKNLNSIELDRDNHKLIISKQNYIGEFLINSNCELQHFEQLKIKDFTQVIPDYKFKVIYIVTFLNGLIVIDMNNGRQIDKLSKDFKGILSCTYDDNSIFVGTTKILFEINKVNGSQRKLLKNYSVKHIHIHIHKNIELDKINKSNKTLIVSTTKGIIFIEFNNPTEHVLFGDLKFTDARQCIVDEQQIYLLTNTSFMTMHYDSISENSLISNVMIKEANKFWVYNFEAKFE